MKIYVDGVLSRQGTSSTITGSLLNNDPVVVGALPSGVEKFSGQIDDLMIFDRELTSSEITSLAGN